MTHRKRPASATTSHNIRSVSCEPEARRAPTLSKASEETAFLCPLNVAMTELAEALQRRIEPSAYPTAKTSFWGEREMQVTSALCPVSCHIASCTDLAWFDYYGSGNIPFDPSSRPIPARLPKLVHTQVSHRRRSWRTRCRPDQRPSDGVRLNLSGYNCLYSPPLGHV